MFLNLSTIERLHLQYTLLSMCSLQPFDFTPVEPGYVLAGNAPIVIAPCSVGLWTLGFIGILLSPYEFGHVDAGL